MSAAGVSQPAVPAQLSFKQWAVVITVSLGALLEIIDTSIINVALTHIQAAMGATLAEVGWVVTSYTIATVVMIPLSSGLSDRFGSRAYFLFCLIGFTAASMLCGLAPTLPTLVMARILQGLLGGGLIPKAQAILFRTIPNALQGITQAAFGVVVLVGPFRFTVALMSASASALVLLLAASVRTVSSFRSTGALVLLSVLAAPALRCRGWCW